MEPLARPIAPLTLALTALLVAGGLAVVWAPPVVPGLDTPHNLVAAWIAAHPDRYAGWFETNWPLTLIAHRAVLAVSFALAPPLAALKVARSIELAVMAAGALAVVSRLGATAMVVVPLAIAACFGWFHLMGYLNFAFALALVPAALALVGDRMKRQDALLLALVGLLVTETHTFVGAGLAAILAAAAICRLRIDRPADPAPSRAVLLAALPSFLAVALTLLAAVGAQPEFETRAARKTTIAQDVAALAHSVYGGYSPLGAPLAALAVAAAAAWLWSERGARSTRWWVGLLSLASLALYVVAPLDGFGWLFLKPRFLPFPFLVAVLPARVPPRLAKPMGALAIALAAAHLAFYGVRSTAAGRATAETIASFGHHEPGAMLPIVFDGHDGHEPAGNLGTLTYDYAYALLDGPGVAPMLFAQNPAIHHVLMTERAEKRVIAQPNPWAYRWLTRAELADQAAFSACRADSVVVIGAWPGDRARLEARGIRFESPGFGRPNCAGGTLRIEPGHTPARVRLGFAETQTWAIDTVVDAPGALLAVQLPAGVVDLLACPLDVDARACVPGGRTIAAQKLTLAPGGTFDASLRWP